MAAGLEAARAEEVDVVAVVVDGGVGAPEEDEGVRAEDEDLGEKTEAFYIGRSIPFFYEAWCLFALLFLPSFCISVSREGGLGWYDTAGSPLRTPSSL